MSRTRPSSPASTRLRFNELVRDLSVVLIGGTSNVGKSTLAQALASRLGWSYISTDNLGRHPGRPWRTGDKPVPAHVASHYLTLSVEDLTTDQLRHYEGMWPVINALVDTYASGRRADRLILEGSGVWPDRVAEMTTAKTAAIWLTASADTVRERIYVASRYAELTAIERVLIDKFVGRTERFNQVMQSAVRRLGLVMMDVDSTSSPDALLERCLQQLSE
jgi:2-phosphoglycerate kinase